VPVVLVSLFFVAFSMRAMWLPEVLYVLGLTTKASMVYFAAPLPIPR
jgi:hypothetical protein